MHFAISITGVLWPTFAQISEFFSESGNIQKSEFFYELISKGPTHRFSTVHSEFGRDCIVHNSSLAHLCFKSFAYKSLVKAYVGPEGLGGKR